MSWFKNMKIRVKMILSFAIVIALMATLTVFAVIELNSVSRTYTNTINFPIEAEIQMRTFSEALVHVRRVTTTMCMFASDKDPDKINRYYSEAAENFEIGLAALDAYEGTVKNGTLPPEQKQSVMVGVNEFRDNFLKYKSDVCDPVAEEARKGNYEGALGFIGSGVELASMLDTACKDMIATAVASSERNVNTAEDTASTAITMFIIIAAVAAIFAIVIALYVAALISKPLKALAGFMGHAGRTGDITMQPHHIKEIEEFSKAKDEIGESIGATAILLRHINNISDELKSIAGGDLTVNIELLSDSDIMGNSLKFMIDNLNGMFGEINNSTEQVSSGSKQVAEGAQILAQGSTEQASVVQQLSASISEINAMAKDNAENATAALAETNEAGRLMEVCMSQMGQMTDAMRTIDDKSKDIFKTTKVIDDIAFQTNILALNAAVEAARAGQHGKGFAVVAEEVRNLASKSAEAAKETASLLESSTQSVEEGNKIVEQVSASLKSVAELSKKNAEKVESVQTISTQQSGAMEQVSTGIDQVSQVIQQNSATAEQSAAASQEMSGQSDMLQERIMQFKLK
ncbi:MAG: methyl-accepting chemotaxis protein [Oscillospiraceae bacterium]|nr:methyl-accepting chemotaxis protein [Oscillospiraceae bacterium]